MSHNREKIIGTIVASVGAVLLIGVLFVFSTYLVQTVSSPNTSNVQSKRPFPGIDTAGLSEAQVAILTHLKQEYEAQPAGTKYTEGLDEPWCADFVSWIMKESGAPFINSETGSWRIDDVPPLVEYFKSVDRLHPANGTYEPKVGDVVMYEKPSPFGDHTNIVIKNDNGILTTVGGNEADEIRIQTFDSSMVGTIIGYGTL